MSPTELHEAVHVLQDRAGRSFDTCFDRKLLEVQAYSAQTDYQALRDRVILAIRVMESGQISHALDNLKHAVGYSQANKEWQDQG